MTSGLGQGAHFMSLPWVQDAVRALVGFTPYPGTLNVRLDPNMVVLWRGVQDGHALVLVPPPPQTCGGRLVPVAIDPDIEAAVVVPDLTSHGDDVLELIAATRLRTRLGLRDHDHVRLLVGRD